MLKYDIKWQELLFMALIALVMFPLDSRADTLLGKVVGVTDGDTATVLDSDNRQHEIRLFAIDAPETSCHAKKPSAYDDSCTETSQPFGKAAKKSLASMIFGQQVHVELQPGDSYSREVGTIWVGNLNANLEQVRRGYAWMWRQYAKRGMSAEEFHEMEEAEKSAKDHKLGLWQDTNPQPPWGFRHLGGGYHGG